MATKAKPPVAETALTAVEMIYAVDPAKVAVAKRLRAIDPAWARALGGIMKRDGQQTPIEVVHNPATDGPDYLLVAGAHRRAGAEAAGIAVNIRIINADRAARRLREVAENLWRKGLDPIDRAAFVAEMHDLLRIQGGVAPDASAQSIAAAARWQKAVKSEAADASVTMTDAYGFTAEIAERLGLSLSAIERDLTLHKRLPAGVAERLAGHPVLGNATQLRALARLDEVEQRRVIQKLRDGARTIAEARSEGSNRQPQGEDKRLSAFIGAFHRMGVAERKGALSQLAALLPAGYRLVYGEQPTAKGFSEAHERYREEALAAIDGAREAIDDLLEDAAETPILDVSARSEDLRCASGALQLMRFSVVSDAFELGTRS